MKSTRTLLSIAGLFTLLIMLNLPAIAQNKLSPKASGLAPVNGLKMYYEVYGEGKPLVLLHGAFMDIQTAFAELIPSLAKNHKVIAMDLQGHGRTADISRPFSVEAMADDVAATLRLLKVDSADIIGYSMGGSVAAQVAIRHTALVRKLVILSAVFKYEGWGPETRAIFPIITGEMFEGSPIKQRYEQVAPDPKGWNNFITKMKVMITAPYDFTAKMKGLPQPTLIILGDADGITSEHASEMYHVRGGGQNGDLAGIPAAQLAVLPGTSHTGVMMRTDWLLTYITPFIK